MRYSAKEEELMEEIRILSMRIELLHKSGRELDQEILSFQERLENRIFELAALCGD